MHIRAEHRCLFPAIRTIPKGPEGILEMFDELRNDHEFFMTELARAIEAMRLTFSFGNEAETIAIVRVILVQVKERLKIHNRIEEDRIYPLVNDGSLELAAVRELAIGIEKELNNYPQRFVQGGR